MTEHTAESFTENFAAILAEAQAADAPKDQDAESPGDPEEAGPAGEDDPQPSAGAAEEEIQPGGESGEGKAPPGPVPYSRFKEINEKNQTLEQQLAAAQKQLDAFNQLLSKQIERPEGKKEEDVKLPEELDPLDPDTTKLLLGHIRKLEGKIEDLTAKTTTSDVVTTAKAQRADFERVNPDFQAALDYYGAREVEKYEAVLGDRGEAVKAAQAALGQAVALCHQNKKNVAETLYRMAVASGYKKTAVKPGGPNLDKLAENKQKTATVANIPGAAASPNPIGVIASKEGFEKHMLDNKGRVDSAKFQKMLKNIADNAARGATV